MEAAIAKLSALVDDYVFLERKLNAQPDVGVHVFLDALASKLAGLYVFVPGFGYCMRINRLHPKERRRWTIAHEYGHFMLDRDKPGVDYLRPMQRKPENERFADSFAAAFLMPEAGVQRRFYEEIERKCGKPGRFARWALRRGRTRRGSSRGCAPSWPRRCWTPFMPVMPKAGATPPAPTLSAATWLTRRCGWATWWPACCPTSPRPWASDPVVLLLLQQRRAGAS